MSEVRQRWWNIFWWGEWAGLTEKVETHMEENPKFRSDVSFAASCPHQAKQQKHCGETLLIITAASSHHTETHQKVEGIKMDEGALGSINQACTRVEAGWNGGDATASRLRCFSWVLKWGETRWMIQEQERSAAAPQRPLLDTPG